MGTHGKTRGTSYSSSSRTGELEVVKVGEAELVDVGHVLLANLGVRIGLVLVDDALDVPLLQHARDGDDTARAMLFWESVNWPLKREEDWGERSTDLALVAVN